MLTSCKIKAGCSICMTSKQKYMNQLQSDKFVGIKPAQILHEDRYAQLIEEKREINFID